MIDTEEKQVLDKARKGQDLEELHKQTDADAYIGPVEQELVEDFYEVTATMTSTLSEVPDIPLDKHLDTPEYYAIKALYMAKTGKDLETGGMISGTERSELLNQALIYLQPILALGLRPDFKDGRAVYDQLVNEINQVREDIKTAVKVQNYIKSPKVSAGKSEEQDDEDDEAGDDTPDEPGAEDSGNEASVEDSKAPKRSLWQRLTGKSSGNK